MPVIFVAFAVIVIPAAVFLSFDVRWYLREGRLLKRHPFYELPLRERLKVIWRALCLDFRPLFRLHHRMIAADRAFAGRYFQVQKLKVHLLRTLFFVWALLMICGIVLFFRSRS